MKARTLVSLLIAAALGAGCTSNQIKPISQVSQNAAETIMPAPQTEIVYDGKRKLGTITKFGDNCMDVEYIPHEPFAGIKRIITNYDKNGRQYEVSAIMDNNSVETINLNTGEKRTFDQNGVATNPFLSPKAEYGLCVFNLAEIVLLKSESNELNRLINNIHKQK